MVVSKACNLLECRGRRERRAWIRTSSRILDLTTARRRWAQRLQRMSTSRFSLFTCHLRARRNSILVNPISRTSLGRPVAPRDCESSLAPIMPAVLDPHLLAVPRCRAYPSSKKAEFNTKTHSKNFLLCTMVWAQTRSSPKTAALSLNLT